MNPYCPYCGKTLSPMEIVLAEQDETYQCHNCWNRIGRQEAGEEEFVGAGATRHGDKSHSARHHKKGTVRRG